MRAAKGYASVGKDRRMTYVESPTEKDPETGRPKMTAISYGEHKFLKATLEGKTVYLHRFWKVSPRLDIGHFEIHTSFTLYNDKLQFMVQRTMQQVEGKTKTQELRWREGTLYRKIGKKKKETALPTTARPESLIGVMMLQERKNKSKRTVQVLVGDKVEPVEILMVGMARGEQGATIHYSSTGAFEGKWWVSPKGHGLIQARLKKPAIAIDSPSGDRSQCGLALDRGRVCSKAPLAKAHKASSGKKRKWKNKFVGLSLRLPAKDWKQDDNVFNSLLFSAIAKNNVATIQVMATYVPYSVDFDGFVDARINTDRPKALERKIDREDVEIAGKDAVRMDYEWVSRGHNRHETSYFFEGKGCILELKLGHWTEPDYDSSRDFKYVLKHLKFDK